MAMGQRKSLQEKLKSAMALPLKLVNTNLTLAQLKKPAERGDINYLVDFLMEKEMENGFSGMIMDKLRSKVNIIVAKNMVSGHFGTTMVKLKNKAHLVLVKQIACINIGLIMATLKKSNDTKKDQLMVDGPNGIKKIPL